MLKEFISLNLINIMKQGLNPYFNGTCSKRYGSNNLLCRKRHDVLILILMEHAQRE